MAKPKRRTGKPRAKKISKKSPPKRTTAKRPARKPGPKRKAGRKAKLAKPWIVKLWEAFNYQGAEIKVANSTPDFRNITDNQGHIGVMWQSLSSFQVADGYTAHFYRSPQYIEEIFSGGGGSSTPWLAPGQNDAAASMKIVDNATGKMVPEAGDD